ncbi:MAG TPA: hypothetical protein VN700_15075 [Vicinamibacterales bacterium]|nr:hypothetical protein [Vicinamibacterales bacterium]
MSTRLPGRWLLAIAPFVFDDVVLTSVIHQSVADMRDEWLRAGSGLAERLKALGRGYVAFWVLVVIAPVVFSKRQSLVSRVQVFSQFAGSFDMVTIRRFRFVVILFILGLGAGNMVARAQPVLYTSSAVLQVVPPRVGLGILDQTKLVQPQALSERIRSTTQVVLSRRRLERMIKEFNLYESERLSMSNEEVAALMRSRIAIAPNDIGPSALGGQIYVSYTASAPVVAMKVAEKVAESVIEESLKESVRRAEGTAAFIEAELKNTEAELIVASKRWHDAPGPAGGPSARSRNPAGDLSDASHAPHRISHGRQPRTPTDS